MIDGILRPLRLARGDPAEATLVVAREADGEELLEPLNALLGEDIQLEHDGRIICSACGAATRRSYADGHCYACFKRLARCDLCVVSPARCHYAQGTCREPEWGEAFCMRPHRVYLANSSGPKVGITSGDSATGRWLDQGASQGVIVARTPTRHLAGVLEETLARRIGDRTDWRMLVTRDAPPVDLAALRERLRPEPDELPGGVEWLDDEPVEQLTYPVLRYPRGQRGGPVQLELQREPRLRGVLLGIKGQYLLFEHGVLNVRRHNGFHIRLARTAELAPEDLAARVRIPQMELFPE